MMAYSVMFRWSSMRSDDAVDDEVEAAEAEAGAEADEDAADDAADALAESELADALADSEELADDEALDEAAADELDDPPHPTSTAQSATTHMPANRAFTLVDAMDMALNLPLGNTHGHAHDRTRTQLPRNRCDTCH